MNMSWLTRRSNSKFQINMNIIKQGFKKKDWNEYFSKNSSYFYLEVRDGMVWAAFVASETPKGAEELSDDEMRLYDEYRRRNNIRPFPMESNKDHLPDQMEHKTEAEKKESREELDKLREEMGMRKKMSVKLDS